jgi:hypothetical protein
MNERARIDEHRTNKNEATNATALRRGLTCSEIPTITNCDLVGKPRGAT